MDNGVMPAVRRRICANAGSVCGWLCQKSTGGIECTRPQLSVAGNLHVQFEQHIKRSTDETACQLGRGSANASWLTRHTWTSNWVCQRPVSENRSGVIDLGHNGCGWQSPPQWQRQTGDGFSAMTKPGGVG